MSNGSNYSTYRRFKNKHQVLRQQLLLKIYDIHITTHKKNII